MTRRSSPTPVEATAVMAMVAVACSPWWRSRGRRGTAGLPWVLVWALVTAVVLLAAPWPRPRQGWRGGGHPRSVRRRRACLLRPWRLPSRWRPRATRTSSSTRLLAALATVRARAVIAALSFCHCSRSLLRRRRACPASSRWSSLATVDAAALALLAPPMWPAGTAPSDSDPRFGGLAVNLAFWPPPSSVRWCGAGASRDADG